MTDEGEEIIYKIKFDFNGSVNELESWFYQVLLNFKEQMHGDAVINSFDILKDHPTEDDTPKDPAIEEICDSCGDTYPKGWGEHDIDGNFCFKCVVHRLREYIERPGTKTDASTDTVIEEVNHKDPDEPKDVVSEPNKLLKERGYYLQQSEVDPKGPLFENKGCAEGMTTHHRIDLLLKGPNGRWGLFCPICNSLHQIGFGKHKEDRFTEEEQQEDDKQCIHKYTICRTQCVDCGHLFEPYDDQVRYYRMKKADILRESDGGEKTGYYWARPRDDECRDIQIIWLSTKKEVKNIGGHRKWPIEEWELLRYIPDLPEVEHRKDDVGEKKCPNCNDKVRTKFEHLHSSGTPHTYWKCKKAEHQDVTKKEQDIDIEPKQVVMVWNCGHCGTFFNTQIEADECCDGLAERSWLMSDGSIYDDSCFEDSGSIKTGTSTPEDVSSPRRISDGGVTRKGKEEKYMLALHMIATHCECPQEYFGDFGLDCEKECGGITDQKVCWDRYFQSQLDTPPTEKITEKEGEG